MTLFVHWKRSQKKNLFHLILIEECGEEAEECEGGQHGHGVGAEGIGPRQGRVHFLSVSTAPLAIWNYFQCWGPGWGEQLLWLTSPRACWTHRWVRTFRSTACKQETLRKFYLTIGITQKGGWKWGGDKAVWWIQNDLFRIQLLFWEFRIHTNSIFFKENIFFLPI